MRTSRLPLAASVVGILALSAACASSPNVFEGYMEAGLYAEAAQTFASDSTLWNQPKALLLAGTMFSNPALAAHDESRGRQVLERLVMGFPGTVEALQASVLLQLFTKLDELGDLEDELNARTAELERRAAQADTLAVAQIDAERELQTLRRRIERLEADLQQAREELERLKAIDLRRRPDGRR